MIRRARPAALTLILLSCSSPPPERAADPAGPQARVRRLVAQIDANLFGEPEDAISLLAGVGRPGVPFMKEELRTSGERARPLLTQALERVYATDPHFLVRAPDRRVTARLKSVTRRKAYEEMFRVFPMKPRLFPQDDLRSPEATIWLDDATYWETVRRFCLAYALDLEDGFFEPGRWSGWSEPHGPFIVRADKEGDALEVRIHLQPGSAPIDGAVHSLRILDASGREIGNAKPVQVEAFGGSFMARFGDRASATLGGADVEFPGDPPAGPLTVTGVARVLSPSEVEAAVWTSEDWMASPEREIGGCRIELLSFDGIDLRHYGGSGRPSEEYRNHAWIFLSDDAGFSTQSARLPLSGGGGGAMKSTGQWPADRLLRRLSVVRPAKAEVVEFAFEIKDVSWP